jgi:hypothetical protein
MEDTYVTVAILSVCYMFFIWYTTLHVSLRLRRWRRFELEPENEVHMKDDPVEKVRELYWNIVLKNADRLNTKRNHQLRF